MHLCGLARTSSRQQDEQATAYQDHESRLLTCSRGDFFGTSPVRTLMSAHETERILASLIAERALLCQIRQPRVTYEGHLECRKMNCHVSAGAVRLAISSGRVHYGELMKNSRGEHQVRV